MEERKNAGMTSVTTLSSFQSSNRSSFHPSTPPVSRLSTLLPFLLFKILPALVLLASCVWAWRSAGSSFATL
jgi:hypothetical protein